MKSEDVRLLSVLVLASLGKVSRKQLVEAVMRWPPVLDMVKELATLKLS